VRIRECVASIIHMSNSLNIESIIHSLSYKSGVKLLPYCPVYKIANFLSIDNMVTWVKPIY